MRGKESLIDELIDLFAADLPKRLSAIAEAIDHADASALALQAHALRGGAANFGADRLDELCSMLEEIGRRGPHAEASAIFSQLRAESARVRDALLALRSQPSQAGPPGGARRSEVQRQFQIAVIDEVAMLEQDGCGGAFNRRIGVGVHPPECRRQRA